MLVSAERRKSLIDELEQMLRAAMATWGQARELAIGQVLSPCVDDEAGHFRLLSELLSSKAFHAGFLPREVSALLAEISAFTGELPFGVSAARYLSLLGRGSSKRSAALLTSHHIPLGLLTALLPPRRLRRLFSVRAGRECSTAAWRTFRLRLNDSLGRSQPGWATPVTSDLAPVLGPNSIRHTVTDNHRSHFRVMLRTLLLPLETCGSPRLFGPPKLRTTWWGGCGPARLDWFDRLISAQAEELLEVRQFARSVSRHTGRVVLSCHNASLGAVGGWSFEHLDAATGSNYLDFSAAVEARVSVWAAGNESGQNRTDQINRLQLLWQERLFASKYERSAWDSRFAEKLRDAAQPAAFLSGIAGSGAQPDNNTRFSWSGALRPHQRNTPRDLLSWLDGRLKHFGQGLMRLASSIIEGERLVSTGALPLLVLPWIDKFFISSRRYADTEYLPAVLDALAAFGARPLVLLWDDTSHPESPSLKTALQEMSWRSLSFRGLGVFGEKSGERAGAMEIICREHARTALFALAPLPGRSQPVSFTRALHRMSPVTPSNYHPSWRDDLCFIYTGSKVEPLLSYQRMAEPWPCWLGIRGARVPFGAWLRARLRTQLGLSVYPPSGTARELAACTAVL